MWAMEKQGIDASGTTTLYFERVRANGRIDVCCLPELPDEPCHPFEAGCGNNPLKQMEVVGNEMNFMELRDIRPD